MTSKLVLNETYCASLCAACRVMPSPEAFELIRRAYIQGSHHDVMLLTYKDAGFKEAVKAPPAERAEA